MKDFLDISAELTEHWKSEYNWKGCDPVKLANRFGCSADYVRSVMRDTEKAHPKPKKRHLNEGRCKSCGAPIVWMGNHPFDIKVRKGAAADGVIQSFRESHFATCPDAEKWRSNSRHDASVPAEV